MLKTESLFKSLEVKAPEAAGNLEAIAFSGFEGISLPFEFNLTVVSDNLDINQNELLHMPVSVYLKLNSEYLREFNGMIYLIKGEQPIGNLRRYQFIIKPWFWFLNFASGYQIFQNKNSKNIIEYFFKKFNFLSYDFSLITKDLKMKEYITQYDESVFFFLNRIIQEDNLLYLFRVTSGKHIMYFSDQLQKLSGMINHREVFCESAKFYLNKLEEFSNFYSGKVLQKSFDFKNSENHFLFQSQRKPNLKISEKYENFFYQDIDQEKLDQENLTELRLNAQESLSNLVKCESDCYTIEPGLRVIIENESRNHENKEYIVLSVQHHIHTSVELQDFISQPFYFNSFISTPFKQNYKSPPLYQKPRIRGPQTAVVVGPKDEKIFTNKYGQIKVRFHFSKQLEESTCWLRVVQNLAGNNWGYQYIPYIGQEVLVDFIDGDPDKPIILGCLYNQSHMPPYHLPAEKFLIGLKSASGNQLILDDTPDNEKLMIYSKKDCFMQAENDSTVNLKNGNYTIEAKAGKVVITAQQSIEFKTAASSIIISPDAILIKSKTIDKLEE